MQLAGKFSPKTVMTELPDTATMLGFIDFNDVAGNTTIDNLFDSNVSGNFKNTWKIPCIKNGVVTCILVSLIEEESTQENDETDSKQITALDATKPETAKDNELEVYSEKEDGVIDMSSRRETATWTILDKRCLPNDRYTSAELRFDKDEPDTENTEVEVLNTLRETI